MINSVKESSMTWKLVCPLANIPAGLKQYDTGKDGPVLMLRSGDNVYACEAICPHLDTPLEEGLFDGEVLTCHQHLWQWNVAEGGEPQGLAEKPLRTYEVKCEDGNVYVRIENGGE
jgi:toluene monooxygenase system ferredoxin subunit